MEPHNIFGMSQSNPGGHMRRKISPACHYDIFCVRYDFGLAQNMLRTSHMQTPLQPICSCGLTPTQELITRWTK